MGSMFLFFLSLPLSLPPSSAYKIKNISLKEDFFLNNYVVASNKDQNNSDSKQDTSFSFSRESSLEWAIQGWCPDSQVLREPASPAFLHYSWYVSFIVSGARPSGMMGLQPSHRRPLGRRKVVQEWKRFHLPARQLLLNSFPEFPGHISSHIWCRQCWK